MKNSQYNYKVMAKSELERQVRDLESKKKQSEGVNDIKKVIEVLEGKISFAECINLINGIEGNSYRKRLEKIIREHEIMQRNEHQSNIVDDFENPRERAVRYFNMDKVNADIVVERVNNKSNVEDIQEVKKNSCDKEVR